MKYSGLLLFVAPLFLVLVLAVAALAKLYVRKQDEEPKDILNPPGPRYL